MITIIFSVSVHASRAKEFRTLVEKATTLSRGDDGCLSYVWHQQKDVPHRFLLREQWRDQQALGEHIKHLIEVFGPPRPGGQLPASIMDFCESFDVKFYDEIA